MTKCITLSEDAHCGPLTWGITVDMGFLFPSHEGKISYIPSSPGSKFTLQGYLDEFRIHHDRRTSLQDSMYRLFRKEEPNAR